jgi:hypothetical protein
MQNPNAANQPRPQFERTPEAFPKLTVFPDGWDLSAILPASQAGKTQACLAQISKAEPHAGSANPVQ